MTRKATLTITTPEGVQFALPLAQPVSRMLAYSIDLAVIASAEYALAMALRPFSVFHAEATEAVMVVLYFAISLLYGTAAEWFWRGQTVGKRLLRLRVIDARALRLEPAQVVVRNLMRAVDALPLFYLAGGVACVVSRRQQRLGDLVAGTVVIRNPRLTAPDLQQILGHKYNSLAANRPLSMKLRQKVNPAVAALALDAVLRRDEFEPKARVAVFRDFSSHFRQMVPYPPDAAEQLSDEQYVRNVVQILYSRPSGSGTTQAFSMSRPG